VHTSTVTVAVLDAVDTVFLDVPEHEFRIEWFSGSGAGGQHRNKHQNSCRVHHIPTGLCEARQGRERETNLVQAKAALLETLLRQKRAEKAIEVASHRSRQVGSGMRGDKTYTIRFQDDRVTAHETERTMSAARYMRGYMDELWR
jgi:protein subunit release factor A